LVLAGTLTVALTLADRVPLEAAAVTPEETVVLDLRLAAWQGLSPLSKRVLAAEAAAIWRQSRIQLRWVTGPSEREGTEPLRVLVAPHAVASHGSVERWTVGELLRFNEEEAIAVASVAGARRIVEASGHFHLFDLPEHHDHRLGIILGRAIAHEIGHYLLRTSTHANEGLMRATIDAQEFADVRSRAFRLDEAAQAYLATLAARVAAAPVPAFSYAPR
jgi:hypothetical protein